MLMTQVDALVKEGKLSVGGLQATICITCGRNYGSHYTMDLEEGRGVVCFKNKSDRVFSMEEEEKVVYIQFTALLIRAQDYFKHIKTYAKT